MQRNGVHMAQLLDALHDIGQLAQTVLAFVGRALRSGGEDAEREDVDEMQSVDHAAIERLHLARDDLSGRFERVLAMPTMPAKSLAVPAGMMPSSSDSPRSRIRLTT